MKTIIVHYSHTGNNAVLAEKVAAEINADSFRLEETAPRTTKTIILDMLFNRSPRLKALPENIENYDLVVFMGPVWMFRIAAPLKTCFRAVKSKIGKYAFVSLNGGALGPNTKIAAELVRRLGKGLAICLDLNIAKLCQVKEEATTDDTGAYLLSEHPEDLRRLTAIAAAAFR